MLPPWAISLIITVLQKTGAINWLEGLAIRGGLDGLEALKKVKTYSAPSDFPEQKSNFTP